MITIIPLIWYVTSKARYALTAVNLSQFFIGKKNSSTLTGWKCPFFYSFVLPALVDFPSSYFEIYRKVAWYSKGSFWGGGAGASGYSTHTSSHTSVSPLCRDVHCESLQNEIYAIWFIRLSLSYLFLCLGFLRNNSIVHFIPSINQL
jgi:hypothetical protein